MMFYFIFFPESLWYSILCAAFAVGVLAGWMIGSAWQIRRVG